MVSWEDTSRAAMSREEAALLPALPKRRSSLGRTALQERLQAAKRMAQMRVTGEYSALIDAVAQAEGRPGRQGRAALHHVMK